MTSSDNQAGGIRPRPVVDLLPRYAAGKPPVPVEGLVSYKLSSNENPMPRSLQCSRPSRRRPTSTATGPAEQQTARGARGFLDVPAEDIVTGAGSLGPSTVAGHLRRAERRRQADEVIYAWRSFEAYPISVGLAGADSVQIPLTAEGRHDLDAMAARLTARTRMILLCTPNNPTGPILTTRKLSASSRGSRGRRGALTRRTRSSSGPRTRWTASRCTASIPNVVVLRTFSKAHGLAGLRVGYSVSQPELTQHLRVTATPFAVSQIAEAAAVTSLQHFGEVVERVQSLVDERDRVTAGLRELGWFVPDAQGNFVWLNLGANSAEFAALAGERALSVRAFGTEGVRVSIGEPEAQHTVPRIVCDLYKSPAAFLALNMKPAGSPLRIK